jgi:hypothetical protein
MLGASMPLEIWSDGTTRKVASVFLPFFVFPFRKDERRVVLRHSLVHGFVIEGSVWLGVVPRIENLPEESGKEELGRLDGAASRVERVYAWHHRIPTSNERGTSGLEAGLLERLVVAVAGIDVDQAAGGELALPELLEESLVDSEDPFSGLGVS